MKVRMDGKIDGRLDELIVGRMDGLIVASSITT